MSLMSALTWDLINFIMWCRFWLKIISREKNVHGTHSTFLYMWDLASCLQWLLFPAVSSPSSTEKPSLPLVVSRPSLFIYVSPLQTHRLTLQPSAVTTYYSSYVFSVKEHRSFQTDAYVLGQDLQAKNILNSSWPLFPGLQCLTVSSKQKGNLGQHASVQLKEYCEGVSTVLGVCTVPSGCYHRVG